MPEVSHFEDDGEGGYLVYYTDGSLKHVDADGVPHDPYDSAALMPTYYPENVPRAGGMLPGTALGAGDPTNPYSPSATGSYGTPQPQQPQSMPRQATQTMAAPPANFGGGTVPHPAYANGQVHPAWGGQPLQPGGYYRGPSPADGGRGQQQIYANGAAAGPFDTHAPQAPGGHSYGGSSSGGGGGGGGSSLYQAWRSKLTSKLYPGSGSGYQDYGSHSGSYKTPKIDKPVVPKMRGPYAKGMDPEQAMSLYDDPTAMIPRVSNGRVSQTGQFYNDLEELPATQYALLSTSKKRSEPWFQGMTESQLNGHRQPNQPRQFVNALGSVYDAAAGGELPDTNELLTQLANTKNRSALGQMMMPRGYRPTAIDRYRNNGQAVYRKGDPIYNTPPVEDATGTFQQLSDAIGYQHTPEVAQAQSEFTRRLADQWASRQLNRDPRRMHPIWRDLTPNLVSGNY